MRGIFAIYIEYHNISMLMIHDTHDLDFGLRSTALKPHGKKPCGLSSQKCGVWSWELLHITNDGFRIPNFSLKLPLDF